MCTGMTHYNQPDGWISVKDRFPEIMKKVLVCDEEVGITVGIFAHHTASWFVYRPFDEDKRPMVTHWRPLPEPPRMDGDLNGR